MQNINKDSSETKELILPESIRVPASVLAIIGFTLSYVALLVYLAYIVCALLWIVVMVPAVNDFFAASLPIMRLAVWFSVVIIGCNTILLAWTLRERFSTWLVAGLKHAVRKTIAQVFANPFRKPNTPKYGTAGLFAVSIPMAILGVILSTGPTVIA